MYIIMHLCEITGFSLSRSSGVNSDDFFSSVALVLFCPGQDMSVPRVKGLHSLFLPCTPSLE